MNTFAELFCEKATSTSLTHSFIFIRTRLACLLAYLFIDLFIYLFILGQGLKLNSASWAQTNILLPAGITVYASRLASNSCPTLFLKENKNQFIHTLLLCVFIVKEKKEKKIKGRAMSLLFNLQLKKEYTVSSNCPCMLIKRLVPSSFLVALGQLTLNIKV